MAKKDEKVEEKKPNAKTVTYGDLTDENSLLRMAFNRVFNGFFGADVSFDLVNLKKEIKEYQDAFKDERQKLIEMYGEESDERNGEYEIEGKNLATFQNEIDGLRGQEVEIKAKKIKIKSRRIMEFGAKITTNDLIVLEQFVEFETKKKSKKKRKK